MVFRFCCFLLLTRISHMKLHAHMKAQLTPLKSETVDSYALCFICRREGVCQKKRGSASMNRLRPRGYIQATPPGLGVLPQLAGHQMSGARPDRLSIPPFGHLSGRVRHWLRKVHYGGRPNHPALPSTAKPGQFPQIPTLYNSGRRPPRHEIPPQERLRPLMWQFLP